MSHLFFMGGKVGMVPTGFGEEDTNCPKGLAALMATRHQRCAQGCAGSSPGVPGHTGIVVLTNPITDAFSLSFPVFHVLCCPGVQV